MQIMKPEVTLVIEELRPRKVQHGRSKSSTPNQRSTVTQAQKHRYLPFCLLSCCQQLTLQHKPPVYASRCTNSFIDGDTTNIVQCSAVQHRLLLYSHTATQRGRDKACVVLYPAVPGESKDTSELSLYKCACRG